MNEAWDSLYSSCLRAWEARGLTGRPAWPAFEGRLHREFRRLAELLWGLYGGRPDYAFQVEALVAEAFASWEARPERLKERDELRPPESGWFLSEAMVGAVCYAGRFAGGFRGLADRIPYLKELGVGYLHLMPFFRSPEGHNDGGYAVSSYRDCDPALGDMGELEALAEELERNGIALVADFVFNHTSDEHEWARKAKAGETAYRDYYYVFRDYAEAEAYQRTLRDIFPEARRGSFTYIEELGGWVWTTFHSYQWDLNYKNPALFRAMAAEMLSLANRGVAALRLDAVAFVWKELGTACENLPQAHAIIRAFQCVCRLACPSLVFKSEAIVHPDDIARYVDLRECQLSYNPLLMAELWEAAATKEVKLLAHSLAKRHALPEGCAWVNYVRCHDDIGWTFADEDARELWMDPRGHRDFLNAFYLGEFPGSFSRGVSFQYNPATGDRRICGSAASLAGVERALESGGGAELATAKRRLLLLYGVAFSAGGIPLIYLGDELAALNDYGYEADPAKAADSRWVHRPLWSDEAALRRADASTLEGSTFGAFARMARIRAAHPVFGSQGLSVVDSGHPSVLAFRKQLNGEVLTVIGNFSEGPVALEPPALRRVLAGLSARDLLSERLVTPDEPLELDACALVWAYAESGAPA